MTDRPGHTLACHLLLLRLAGRIPDELLGRCRRQLAGGQLAELAADVTDAILYADLPLVADDVALLDTLLTEAGRDPRVLDEVELVEREPGPRYWFCDVALAEYGGVDDGSADRLARAAVAVAAGHPGVRGLWQAWRMPLEIGPTTTRPVFVVEADPGEHLPTLAVALQDVLAGMGDDEPRVEVVPVGAQLPAYHRAAIGYGALRWARDPEVPFQLVRLFDELDPLTGPSFAADHPRIDDPAESTRILEYLAAGRELLLTDTRLVDVVGGPGSDRVPLNFRTDGTFIWTDATACYLERYGFAPDPVLLDHMRAGGYRSPPVDAVTTQRALVFLRQRTEDEPAWTFEVAQ